MLPPSHLAGCDGGRGDAHSPLGRQRHPRHGRVSAADGAREMSPTATEHCLRPRFHSHATRICATSFPWQPPGVDSLVPPMCRLEAVTRAQGTGPPLASGEAPLGRVRAAPSAAGAHCLAGPPRWGSRPGARVAARSTLRNADAGLPAGWTVRWVEGSHEAGNADASGPCVIHRLCPRCGRCVNHPMGPENLPVPGAPGPRGTETKT